MVICLERGAVLHMVQLMPLPLTASCFSKIQIGFTFLLQAHPCSPGKRAVKRVCVCVLHVYLFAIKVHVSVNDDKWSSMVHIIMRLTCVCIKKGKGRRRQLKFGRLHQWRRFLLNGGGRGAEPPAGSRAEPLVRWQRCSGNFFYLWERIHGEPSLPFPSHPPFPLPIPFLPFSHSFPSLPLRSRHPRIAARGSGGALKLPQRVRGEPGRQTHSGAF